MEVFDIALFSPAGDLVEPANGGGFEAWFGEVVLRVDYFDLHLNGIPAALDPPFPLFASLFHADLIPKVDRYQLGPATSRQPRPNRFDLGTIRERLSHHNRRVRLATRPLPQQFRVLKTGKKLPRGYKTFLTPLICMPAYDEAIVLNRLSYSTKE